VIFKDELPGGHVNGSIAVFVAPIFDRSIIYVERSQNERFLAAILVRERYFIGGNLNSFMKKL
jgi:hypothetical protein